MKQKYLYSLSAITLAALGGVAAATAYQNPIVHAENINDIKNIVDTTGSNGLSWDSSGYTSYNSWTNLKASTLAGKIKIVGHGQVNNLHDLQQGGNYKVYAYSTDNSLDNSHIIQSIHWDGAAKAVSGETTYHASAGSTGWTHYDLGPHIDSFDFDGKATFEMPNAVHLANGQMKDLYATISTGGGSRTNNHMTVWNKDKAVNYTTDYWTSNYNDINTEVWYHVGSPNGDGQKYLWIDAVSDIDGGQTVMNKMGGDAAFISVGGGLSFVQYNGENYDRNDQCVQARPDLGFAAPGPVHQNALDGLTDTPTGVAVLAAYTDTFHKTLTNTKRTLQGVSGKGTGVADADFGAGTSIPIEVPPSFTDVNRKKTVNKTIHYVYNAGDKKGQAAAPDNNQSKNFMETGKRNSNTGAITWNNNWTGAQKFDDITSPHIQGWHADRTVVTGQTVDHDSNDIVETVYYEPDDTSKSATKTVNETIHYIYRNGPKAGQEVAPDHLDSKTFTHTWKEALGQVIVGSDKWTDPQKFDNVKSPNAADYKCEEPIYNGQTVDHNSRDIEKTIYYNWEPHPDPVKTWVENNVQVDNKTYIAGDDVHARVQLDLPDKNAFTNGLTKFAISDNYSRFADKVDYKNAHVYENGRDVTDQYNITNSNGHITATRKDPNSTPTGKAELDVTFTVKQGVASGTKLDNTGIGFYNDYSKETDGHNIVTYKQTTDKHWVEGSQVVDGKTYVAGDNVHAEVSMSLPNYSELAKPLSQVKLDDNYSQYASHVRYIAAHVYENGNDVSEQYNIVNNNGHVIATRKDPRSTPSGEVRLQVEFSVNSDTASGTVFHNNASGTLNNVTVPTSQRDIVTYRQNTNKHWVEGSQVVDGKTYIDDDIITGQVNMTLPDPNSLAKKLSQVALTDNYSNFADKVDYLNTHVYENGKDVTSQYDIYNDTKSHFIKVRRKDASLAPSGNVSLKIQFKIHDNVPTGTVLTNSGSGTINNVVVPTDNVNIVTYKQTTNKHWVAGQQVVDNKTYIAGDTVTGKVHMDMPDPNQLAAKLTNVQLDDDYTQFANHVKFASAQVLENGKDVTNQYTITNANGHVTAMRKDPGAAPGGSIDLVVKWQVNLDTPTKTELTNKGSGTINSSKVNTAPVTIHTYTQTDDKHWVAGDQVVDGKTYIDHDHITAKISMSLPQADQLAEPLKQVQIDDDYSSFADKVDYVSGQVLENGKDVTSQYNIEVRNGHVIATRKDPSKTPSGNVVFKPVFRIHTDVPSGTVIVNKANGTLNYKTVPTNTPPITTYKQDTNKHWTVGDHVVDNKIYIANDQAGVTISMTLPDPNKLAERLTKVQIDDNYTAFADKVDFVSAQVWENGKDVTSQYNIEVKNGHVIATRKDPGSAPGGMVVLKPIFHIHDNVPTGTALTNLATGTLNTEDVPTPPVTVHTYTQKTDKHWTAGNQNVDGKTYINNDMIHANISMTMPDPSQLADKLTQVQIDDNYTRFAQYVDYKNAHVYENGKDVTSLYNIEVKNGHVTATRKDPGSAPGGNIELHVQWQIKKSTPNNTNLFNDGSGTLNHKTVSVPERNIVTFRQAPDKHWVENGQTVDGKTYISGDTVNAQVTMNMPDADKLAEKLTHVSVTDIWTNFKDKVDFKEAHVYENGRDVTGLYNIAVDKENGIVTATRKDAASAPSGHIMIQSTFTIKRDVPSGTVFINSGAGQLNTYSVPTPNRNIVTYRPNTDKHWVEGSQSVDGKTYINNDMIHADVTMTLPEPSTLARKLSKVVLVDDYVSFAPHVKFVSAQVYENGKDVTSLYSITNEGGKVYAERKDAASTPNGKATLHINWSINSDVPSGTTFVNTGFGTINNTTVPTPNRNITTYKPAPDKHWVNGNQVVDNTQVLTTDTLTARVNMEIPDVNTMGRKFSSIGLTDDWSSFKDKVTVANAHVYENGKDVTNEFNIVHDANTGKTVATRKDPARENGGQLSLEVTFNLLKDKIDNNYKFVNSGSGTINQDTVPTPQRTVTTYHTKGDKHWELNNETTDNKVYAAGDIATAKMTVDLPENTKDMKKLVIDDDFTKFADKVSVNNVKILEAGKNVTNDYSIKIDPNGHVTATRKDPTKIAAGQKAEMFVDFKINQNTVAELENNGSITVNTDTLHVPPVKIVVWTPKPHKDVALGQDTKGETTKSIDGDLILSGDYVTYPLSTDDLPANRAEDIKSRQIVDTLPNGANFIGFKAWLKDDQGNLVDVTNHVKLTQNGQKLTFTDDDYLLGLYNEDKSKAHHTPIIDLVVQNKGYQKEFDNQFTIYTNNNVSQSNIVHNHTNNKPQPKKEETNQQGQKIDGKEVLPGSINNYQLIWNMDAYKNVKASSDAIKQGFYFVDDYPDEALDPLMDSFAFTDANGNAVKGIVGTKYSSIQEAPSDVQAMLKKNNINPKGAFIVFKASNPEQFFKDYVEKGINLKLTAPMKVKEGFTGQYQNKAWQVDFGKAIPTNIVSNNVPKINPKKDVVLNVNNQKSLNGQTIEQGSYFDYALRGAIIPANGTGVTEYGAIDKYDTVNDQFFGAYKAILSTDVVLKNGQVLKKGTDITKFTHFTNKNGKIVIEVNKDFLQKIDFNKSQFGVDFFLQMKRVGSGQVKNVFTNTVNGLPYQSNEVVTNTKIPKKFVPTITPKKHHIANTIPQLPVEDVPDYLPENGSDKANSVMAAAGLASLALTTVLGGLYYKKRERN